LDRLFKDKPYLEEARLFLQTVWAAFPSESILGLTYDVLYTAKGDLRKGERPVWITREGLAEFFEEGLHSLQARNDAPDESGNIYFRPAARKRVIIDSVNANRYRTGTLDELTVVNSIWCDIDCAARGIDYDRAFGVLRDMQASIIWFTGGGLQAIWIADKLIDVSSSDLAREFKARALAFLLPRFKAEGIEVDTSVHDATRMLRLVGFKNKKPSRKGAVATILHFEPDRRLAYEDFMRIELPKPVAPIGGTGSSEDYVTFVNKSVNDGKQGDELYFVSGEFVARLIKREQPVERHPALVKVAASAAKAGIPMAALIQHLRPLAVEWFSKTGEQRRAFGELDSLVAWAYQNVEQGVGSDRYAVRLTENGFELVDDAVRRYRKPIDIDSLKQDSSHAPVIVESGEPEQAEDEPIPLRQIRAELPSVIGVFLDTVRRRGEIGRTLLIKAPLGSGKTHSVWVELHKRALADDKFKAVFYGLFTYSKEQWRAYLADFGLKPDDVFYFEARNGNKGSAGYCAFHEEAEQVANKGYRVFDALCLRCPHLVECQQSWYLSQKEAAEKAQLVYARHNHALMLFELSEGRNAVVIDESIVDLIEAPIQLSFDDFADANNHFLRVNSPDAYQACDSLLRALRAVLAATPTKSTRYLDYEKHVRDGRWIVEQLLNYIEGEDVAAKQALLDLALEQSDDFFDELHPIINAQNNTAIIDVENLPRRFLSTFVRLLRIEYGLWKAGHKDWNSRLFAFNNRFQVYPLPSIGVERASKAIVIDGTGDPSVYDGHIKTKDGKKLERREMRVYAPVAPQIAKVVQFADASFSKSSLMSNFAKADELSDSDKGLVGLIPEALKQGLKGRGDIMTSKVLLVCYKPLKAQVKKLIAGDPILKALSRKGALVVEHFGNLRGRNDFADFHCVLIVGTPRIPEAELLMRAKARYHEDPNPIGVQRVMRARPYKGTRKVSLQFDYADERLAEIAYRLVDDEIRQCAERIRPNVPDLLKKRGKLILLLTNFPTSYRVDELHLLTDVLFEEKIEEQLSLLPKPLHEYSGEELIKQLQETGLRNREAIRKALQERGLTKRRPRYQTRNSHHRELAKTLIESVMRREREEAASCGRPYEERSVLAWMHYCAQHIEGFSLTWHSTSAIVKELLNNFETTG